MISHVDDRGADGGGPVDDDVACSMAGGMAACSCGSSGADAIDGIDDVGAGLAEDDQEHGRLAVGIAGVADVFDRIDRRWRHRR